MGVLRTCCGFYCSMTAAIGVYFFFILGIMEFKGNTFILNVLQYAHCPHGKYNEETLTCSEPLEEINKDTKGKAFMITACIELVLVFACYMCGRSSMIEDEKAAEAEKQRIIEKNYQPPA